MLATVLRQPASDDASRQAAWRQLVDLLAQSRTDDDVRLERDAYRRLRDWRQAIPAEVRQAAAGALAGRQVPPSLVRFFSEDTPSVARPLLRAVTLSSLQWMDLLPALSPTARALLRHRADLGAEVERALQSFGSIDFVLEAPEPQPLATMVANDEAPPSAAAPDEPVELPSIAELLNRIERHQKGEAVPPPPNAPAEPTCTAFSFETDALARLTHVEGADVGPLVGLSLLLLAEPLGGQGVDGQVAGAVRARIPFRDGRLQMAQDTPVAGGWRMSGVPVFDPRTGRFMGYRGRARRPRADEEAGQGGLFGLDAPGGSLQQLMHEIRTPLNAIVGFGEMIEHAVLGPAPRDERERAGRIVADARRLVEAVEDLDTAARIAGGTLGQRLENVTPAAMRQVIEAAGAPAARDRGAAIGLAVDPFLQPILADAGRTERMVGRLVAASMLTAAPGERLAVALSGDLDRWQLEVARGARIAGRSEADLLDPILAVEEDEGGPILGLAFSLRLVRSLAEAAGGRLEIRPDRFILTIGSAAPADASVGA